MLLFRGPAPVPPSGLCPRTPPGVTSPGPPIRPPPVAPPLRLRSLPSCAACRPAVRADERNRRDGCVATGAASLPPMSRFPASLRLPPLPSGVRRRGAGSLRRRLRDRRYGPLFLATHRRLFGRCRRRLASVANGAAGSHAGGSSADPSRRIARYPALRSSPAFLFLQGKVARPSPQRRAFRLASQAPHSSFSRPRSGRRLRRPLFLAVVRWSPAGAVAPGRSLPLCAARIVRLHRLRIRSRLASGRRLHKDSGAHTAGLRPNTSAAPSGGTDCRAYHSRLAKAVSVAACPLGTGHRRFG